jgi:lysophospholipase L1-like esterase
MAGQETIQAVPIVSNGIMYISQFNRIDAIDARSGNIVWQYQRQPLTRGAQRGTALYNNKLFVTDLSPENFKKIATDLGIPLEDQVLKDVLYDRDYKSDAIHPNAQGYRKMAEAMAKLLRRAGAV